MLEPSAEKLAELRAAHGAALVVTPPLTAGTETARLALRAFDQASFDRYYDDHLARPETALENGFLRQLLWPDQQTCARLVNARAGLPIAIMRALEQKATGGQEPIAPAAEFDPLETMTSDALLERAKLDRTTAEGLLAQAAHGGIALELVRLRKGAALVLRAPEPVIYEQILAAMRQKKGAAMAARVAAIASTAWCTESPDALFARLPGLATYVVLPALLRLGGAGAESSFRFDD